MPAGMPIGDDPVVNASNRTGDVNALIAAGRDREAARQGARLAEPRGEAMDPVTQLDQIGPVLGGVVANITPGELDLPTPCDTFTVRGVLEHMIAGATAFAAAFRGEIPGEPDLADPLAGFGPALGNLVTAVRAPGALDRTVAAPFGAVPGETFARFVALDGLVHGWDLATATGQAYEPVDAVVAAVDEFARSAVEPLRDGETFGPPVAPHPDATPIERLVAYTGRHPTTRRS